LPWGWDTGEAGPIEQGYKPDDSELHNAEVEPICRKYLNLRYQLLAYNYSLCREAHDSGMPLMRALWLHYPKDAKAVERGDEYLWGRDFLVAPVTASGAKSRTLYLPAGDWFDFWNGERQSGGREITRDVDLGTLPLYMRAGAIVPFEPVRQFTGETTEGPAALRIYSGRDGEFRWYEDDGNSLDYNQGQCCWTHFTWSDKDRRLTIRRDGNGSIKPAAKTLEVIVLPEGSTQTIQYDGQPIDVRI
jgi:alpha-glucosidase/alpha-D-xyloside xylohydrolase